ncbi:MAG: GMC oxidoreductase [Candidatus Sumerlaeia bacterium]|nr:GMC oxidoreductase [Candidatus Sumerlaeia bacterium]
MAEKKPAKKKTPSEEAKPKPAAKPAKPAPKPATAAPAAKPAAKKAPAKKPASAPLAAATVATTTTADAPPTHAPDGTPLVTVPLSDMRQHQPPDYPAYLECGALGCEARRDGGEILVAKDYEKDDPHPKYPDYLGEVHLHAPELRPAHRVAIRGEVDGWTVDVPGSYRPVTWKINEAGDRVILYSAWVFYFDPARYPKNFDFKFVLDGLVWSDGPNHKADLGGRNFYSTQDFANAKRIQLGPAPKELFQYGAEGLSLEMPLDARARIQGPRKTSERFDAIVIGSGMAGGPVANRLAHRGKRVLLLEMGTHQLHTHASNLVANTEVFRYLWSRQADIVGESPFWEGPHFMLGGRSMFWSGIAPRMMDWELDAVYWPDAVTRALKDASPATGGGGYYTQAEELMLKGKSQGVWAAEAAKNMNRHLYYYGAKEMPWAFDKRSIAGGGLLNAPTGMHNSAELIENTLSPKSPAKGNLVVGMGQMALQLHEGPGGRIERVECYDLLANEIRFFEAKEFVLALGSVETPKLCLVSGLRDESGKIGVGLSDHPSFGLGDHDVPSGSRYHDPNGAAKLLITPDHSTASEGCLIGELDLNSRYYNRRVVDPVLERVESEKPLKASLKARSYGELNDNNRVTAQGRGQKARIVYQWVANGRYGNFDNVKRMARDMRNTVFYVLGLKTSDWNDLPDNYKRATIQHAVGSMRMGSSRQHSAVNSDQRVWAYENLYVADASVFPVAPVPNPSLTAVALALRLADHIAAKP